MDFIQDPAFSGNEYALVIVCRWTEAFPCERASAVCG